MWITLPGGTISWGKCGKVQSAEQIMHNRCGTISCGAYWNEAQANKKGGRGSVGVHKTANGAYRYRYAPFLMSTYYVMGCSPLALPLGELSPQVTERVLQPFSNDKINLCAHTTKIPVDNPLFINFYWIFAEKKIPELTLMGCHLPAKSPGIF